MFVYCLQPWMFSGAGLSDQSMGSARYRFLLESLADLDQQLRAFGHSLVVKLGNLENVISELQQQHAFSHVYYSKTAGIYEAKVWHQIKRHHSSVHLVSHHTSTLWGDSQLPFAVVDLPKHFTPFKKQVQSLTMCAPIGPPDAWSEPITAEQGCLHKLLDELPKPMMNLPFSGGAHAANQHLDAYFESQWPLVYKQTRNQLMGWNSSTKFSPWLALGVCSPRMIMQRLLDFEDRFEANESTYWIFFELMWREFFYWNALKLGSGLYKSKKNLRLNSNWQQGFKHWCQGLTNEPLIDACMRQLNLTGYMSNRGRQLAASYLIRELGADWRAGASYFERMLIDCDVASNWGNWQYIAGVGADPRGGRCFNIQKQQQTHDPDGEFRQQWSNVEPVNDTVSWDDLLSG